MKQSTIDAVHDGLWMVVNAAGTGGRARIEGRDVAGKTGTAQVISNQGKPRAGKTDRDLRDHGFFVFFAPAKNPEVAGVVFAEHSEHGSSAAPIAKHMIDTYFAKKEGKPLPVYPVSARPRAEPPAGDAVIVAARARRADPPSRRRSRRTPARSATAAATESVRCSTNAASSPTSTGCCWRPCWRSPRIGLVMIYSATWNPIAGRRGRPAVLDPALRRRHRRRRAGRLPVPRLPAAVRELAHHLPRRRRCCCSTCSFFGVDAGRRAALDFARRLQPAAVGVHEDRAGAGAGDLLRREQPRRPEQRRPGRSPAASRPSPSCSSASSRTSDRRSRCCRSSSGSPSWPGFA